MGDRLGKTQGWQHSTQHLALLWKVSALWHHTQTGGPHGTAPILFSPEALENTLLPPNPRDVI